MSLEKDPRLTALQQKALSKVNSIYSVLHPSELFQENEGFTGMDMLEAFACLVEMLIERDLRRDAQLSEMTATLDSLGRQLDALDLRIKSVSGRLSEALGEEQ